MGFQTHAIQKKKAHGVSIGSVTVHAADVLNSFSPAFDLAIAFLPGPVSVDHRLLDSIPSVYEEDREGWRVSPASCTSARALEAWRASMRKTGKAGEHGLLHASVHVLVKLGELDCLCSFLCSCTACMPKYHNAVCIEGAGWTIRLAADDGSSKI